MGRIAQIRLVLAGTSLLFAAQLHAAAVLYSDPAAFVDAGGRATPNISFEEFAAGTDISGQSASGVLFTALGDPLIVVLADSTYTPNDPERKLPATSPGHILSPGGAELPLAGTGQEDSFELFFESPMQTVGFDVLYQSADGDSLLFIIVYDPQGNILFSDYAPAPGTGPAGAAFMGFVSDAADIQRITFLEQDNDGFNPDSNIGLDSLRVSASLGPHIGLTDSSKVTTEGRRSVGVYVSRTGPLHGPAQVEVYTRGGTARRGYDFRGKVETLSWADGEGGLKLFRVRLINDSHDEPRERFSVKLRDIQGAEYGLQSSTIWIRDND
jgi:hypothetical protein